MDYSEYGEDYKYKPSNRQKVSEPRAHKAFWCESCDADKVHQGEVCGTCGNRAYSLRRKK